LLAAFLTMNLMMLTLVLYSDDVYGASASPVWEQLRSLFRVGSILLAMPVYLIAGAPIARRAWAEALRGRLTADALLAAGAGAAGALDGIVVSGRAEVDTAVVTGESRPVTFGVGDRIVAGAVPASAPLVVESTATLRDSTLARLAAMLEAARAARAPIERTA